MSGAVGEIQDCKPISMRMCNENCVRFKCLADLVEETEEKQETFWDVLRDGGGDWMWEFVNGKFKEGDMDWLREGMVNGTLVWCSDGSYKRKIAPDVSGAG